MANPDTAIPGRVSAGQGILWMLLAQLLFVGSNAVSKHLLATQSVYLIAWGRLVFQMVLVLPLLPWLRPLLVTRCPGLQILRGLCLVTSTVLMITSLQLLPLADASAILYVAPLMITALSVPILAERVGVHRWAAVVVGFVGALVVIRPGTDVLQAAIIVPLSVAFLFAMIQILSRLIARRDGAMTTFVYTSWVAALVATAGLPFIWVVPTLWGWVLMAAVGILAGTGQYAMIRAFQAAPAAVISPFNYTGLMGAAIVGVLVFAEVPDLWTILGAVLITASGLYVFRRERRAPTPGDRHGG